MPAYLCSTNNQAMKSINILILFLSIASAVFAQTSNISGKVYDGKTGETLPGANVAIEGTNYGASTDLDGQFTIAGVPSGNYDVVISFISYQTKKINSVTVKPKEATVLNISLESAAQVFDEIVVVASVNQESANTLLMMQKKSATLSDGIAAENIKRSPDKSVGDVMKRVSGASIQDNKFAVIRGLSDRYNIAMVNGTPLPSTEPDRKAFSFDLFPSNMIDNLVVVKTATPDLPGDFAGGIIQINTKYIPYENFVSLSASTGYNTQSTFNEYYTYEGGKYDWLGIDDGTRAVPDAFPGTDDFKDATKAEKIELSKLFDNDYKVDRMASSPLSQSYQLTFGNKSQLFKNDLGSIISVTYNNSRKLSDIERNDFNADSTNTIIYNFNDKQYKQNISWGALLNLAYKMGDNNKISFQNMFNVNSEDMVLIRTGEHIENEQLIRSNALQFTSTKLLTTQLSGDHLLPKGLKFTWTAAYNKTKRDVPNLRKSFYSLNSNPADEGDTVYSAYVPGTASPNYGGRFYSEMDENVYNGIADLSLPFNLFEQKQSIKIGTFQQKRDRIFDARVMGYVINNFAKFYSTGGRDALFQPYDEIFAEENITEERFRLDEITNKSDAYTANSYLNANYIMFDNNFTAKLRAVWGVRIEQYNQQLNSFDYSNNEVIVDTTFFDMLPSINVIYSVTDNANLRASASRNVSRPEFRELAPFGFYDFNTSTAIVGNPGLQKGNINNFDLRYEYYPGSGQILAVTAFYKHFNNPIEQIVYSGGIGSRVSSYDNIKQATSFGAEVELRKNLNFIADFANIGFFNNMTFFTNAALIQSEVDLSENKFSDSDSRPLQGQSPYLFNAGLGYSAQASGLNVNILYNIFGRRLTEVGENGYKDIYEAPRPLLDLQVSKTFLKKGLIKLNVSDLLNKEAIFYQDQNENKKYDANADTKIIGIKTGTNVSLGVSYTF